MIGNVVSHYRILQKMGGGGMGVVYKAEDLKLRRTVALKFLAPELTRDEDAKKRFLHEAQAASALDHPNICGIHEIDETLEGQLFIAMSCYDGESLKERIARRRIDVEEAFQIAFAVAQGLGRAHASGIIHRDIKPANVMITNDGFVKIIDFGLSKLLGRSRVTGSGTTLGTVAYMSPEQARSEEVDLRADLWALGAVLYEMLTGRLPFRGEIDQAVVYSILNETAEPIRNLRSDVPDVCVAIVEKCLAKDPNDRYQSADEFCRTVCEAAHTLGWGESFTTGGVRAVSVVKRKDGGKNRVWPFAAVLVAVIAAAAWFGLRERLDSPYSTDVRLAVVPSERVGDTPSQCFTDGLSEWLSQMCERLGENRESMWVLPYARSVEDRPADLGDYQATFGVNRLLVSDVQRYADRYRLALRLVDAVSLRTVRDGFVQFSMDDLVGLEREVGRTVGAMLGLEDGDFEATLAVDARSSAYLEPYLQGLGFLQRHRYAGNLDSALVHLRLVRSEDAAFVPATIALARGLELEHLRAGDTSCLEESRALLETALKEGSAPTDVALVLGSVLRAAGDGEEAVRVLSAVKGNRSFIEVQQELGYTYSSMQRYDEAEATYKELTTARSDYYYGHWRLGWLYRVMNRPDDAIASLERALKLAPSDFRTLRSMGVYYSEQGDWHKARALWEKAFLVKPEWTTAANLASIHYYNGHFAEAAKYYEYALESADSTWIYHYSNWGNLACALYWVPGKREEARIAYGQAVLLAEKRLNEAPDDIQTAARLADYYGMLGDRERAKQMISRVAGIDDAEVVYRLACAYASLDDREKALQYLIESVRQSYPLHELRNEPLFRELVRDPRFKQVAEIADVAGEKKQ